LHSFGDIFTIVQLSSGGLRFNENEAAAGRWLPGGGDGEACLHLFTTMMFTVT
jgi:hypothetical protein